MWPNYRSLCFLIVGICSLFAPISFNTDLLLLWTYQLVCNTPEACHLEGLSNSYRNFIDNSCCNVWEICVWRFIIITVCILEMFQWLQSVIIFVGRGHCRGKITLVGFIVSVVSMLIHCHTCIVHSLAEWMPDIASCTWWFQSDLLTANKWWQNPCCGDAYLPSVAVLS